MADHEIIFKTLNELKKKRKGQYHDNVVGSIKINYGWADDLINNVLKDMIGKKLIRKVVVNGKTSYRSQVKDTAFFTDASSTIADTVVNNVDYKESFEILQQDFHDFKIFVTKELSVIKENSCPTPSTESSEITLLKDHIKCLEQQLNEKQLIIDGLIMNIKTPCSPSIDKSDNSPSVEVESTQNKANKAVKKTKSKPNKVKKKVFVVGDSLLNGISEKGFTDHNVSIKAHPGATSNDLSYYIKPIVHKKPDVIIVHCGTNDIPKDLKTVDNLKNMDDYIKTNSPNTKLVISSLILRKDKNVYQEKVATMNERLKKFTTKNSLDFIDHANVNESCLSRSKLHLNRKGNSFFANNLIKYMKE